MDNLIDILRLIRTKNVGNITFFELVKYFGSAKKALEALPNFVGRSLKKTFKVCSTEVVTQEIELCHELGVNIVTYQDFCYPTLLNHIEAKPPVLFAKGNLDLLSGLPLAVVGSRQATLNGIRVTHSLVEQLTHHDIVIVSGMAQGIDTAAHKAALSRGTIAVLGNGINIIFPQQNTSLYHDIINKGLVLSTFPVNTAPLAANFPQRNHYIAGMSLGTLVVEAKLRSGSLLTAYSSINLGREVFAVPGNPNDPNSQGCNKLIKEGAVLVESINDMIEAINKWRRDATILNEERTEYSYGLNKIDNYQFQEMETLKNKLLPLLTHTPVDIDLIKTEFKSDLPLVPLVILELELLGKIIRVAGNKIQLTYNTA